MIHNTHFERFAIYALYIMYTWVYYKNLFFELSDTGVIKVDAFQATWRIRTFDFYRWKFSVTKFRSACVFFLYNNFFLVGPIAQDRICGPLAAAAENLIRVATDLPTYNNDFALADNRPDRFNIPAFLTAVNRKFANSFKMIQNV